jgi:energy-coupling factor transporter transmembrane protein EcfT
MLAVNCYWRWLHSNNARFLALAVVFCIFAASARPTTLLVGVVLGIAVLIAHRQHVGLRSNVAVGAVGLIVLPALFCFGVLFLKFGQPSPPADKYRNPTGEEVEPTGPCNHLIENHPKFLPTNLFAYFRPDAVRLYKDWPNVRFRFNNFCIGPDSPTYLWPLKTGDMYVERTTSLTDTMPIPVLAAGIASFAAVRRRKTKELAVLAALATIGLMASSTFAMTSRYLGDFYPLLATGLAMSATVLGTAKRKSILVTLTCLAVVLVPWSLLANASLLTRYMW